MAITTQCLKFLDITNFLAQGTSYSEYLAAFKITEKKGHFPYEFVDCYEKLQFPQLPSYESFYSDLNNNNPLDLCEDGSMNEEMGRKRHAELSTLWKSQNMSTLSDFLRWYNNLDVSSFISAVNTQFDFFREHLKQDLFKCAISLPGLSLRYAFFTTNCRFSLYGDKFSYFYKLMRDNLTGGPSIVFSRHQEKGLTKIRGVELGVNAKTTQSVIGVDANSLYLWAFSQDMPSGDFEIRHAPLFRREKTTSKDFSLAAIQWLETEAKHRDTKILHKLNGGEMIMGSRRIKVDGFAPDIDTIFQFHGCFYHAHETCFKNRMNEIHPYYNMTFTKVRERTREITEYLQSLGYVVFERWECEIPKSKRRANSLQVENDEKTIINAIRQGKLFGMVECDIMTPESLKPRLAEFPPIFKNTQINRTDIGRFMASYCEKNNVLKKPSRMLISSFYADKILLITPLLKYYLELGLNVTKIHTVIEFPDHQPCFQEFADKCSDARRLGDKSEDNSIISSTFKLLGNSAYGRVCMNKAKQTKTMYADAAFATHLINSHLFKKCSKIDDDLYEIEQQKNKHHFNLPLHLGIFTYQYAKKRMLEWHYQFMQYFLSPESYQLVQMDTDSSYFGISEETLEDAIKPELKREFYETYHQWFPSPACDQHREQFVTAKLNKQPWSPTDCCAAEFTYTKRSPGLFKFEFHGDGIVALCSKTYICFGERETKLSCKGIQKKRNRDKLTRAAYLHVLNTQRPGYGINKGFRAINGKVYTYQQIRHGLSYLYCKREVLDDGVTTRPLNL